MQNVSQPPLQLYLTEGDTTKNAKYLIHVDYHASYEEIILITDKHLYQPGKTTGLLKCHKHGNEKDPTNANLYFAKAH